MKSPKDFVAGDVVFDEEDPNVLAIVTKVGNRSIEVVFENGARAGGRGLLGILRHREPRMRVDAPSGALGNRGWNREQAVTAALRRAGL